MTVENQLADELASAIKANREHIAKLRADIVLLEGVNKGYESVLGRIAQIANGDIDAANESQDSTDGQVGASEQQSDDDRDYTPGAVRLFDSETGAVCEKDESTAVS